MRYRSHSSGTYSTNNYCDNNDSSGCVAYRWLLYIIIIIVILCVLAIIFHDSSEHTTRVPNNNIQPDSSLTSINTMNSIKK